MDVPFTIIGAASAFSTVLDPYSIGTVVFANAVRLSLSSSSSSDGTRSNKSVGLLGSLDRSSELLTRSSLSSSENVNKLETRECGVPPIRLPPSDGDSGFIATETPESVTTGDDVEMFRLVATLLDICCCCVCGVTFDATTVLALLAKPDRNENTLRESPGTPFIGLLLTPPPCGLSNESIPVPLI